ncbi:TetR/AcrR family transcriptional regulator [Nocardioides sp.]|uniref:TetR/AcrR family transcriptional regulator n=1 Tax=Nocardioides sp. TaxID=35761 RepID=UPI0031FEF1D4|nr:TetR family transcriptional regulator [Nocardioides sp.]
MTEGSAIRERALDATKHLVEDGGYEAVHMRDVVQGAGVSLGSLYRYFSGRDHLIAELQFQWIGALSERRDPLPHEPSDRVAELIHQTCVSLAGSPRLGRATVLALQSRDPAVQNCRRRVDNIFMSYFSEVVSDQPFSAALVAEPLRLAWHGALTLWAQGHSNLTELDDCLQETARTLVAGALARVAPATSS